jgi:hypothetical protein
MTRWVTGTRPDQDGCFKVQNPAGTYLAIAGHVGRRVGIRTRAPEVEGEALTLDEGAAHADLEAVAVLICLNRARASSSTSGAPVFARASDEMAKIR